MLWNCHGYKNFEEIETTDPTTRKDFDIICLNETWLTKPPKLNLYLENKYNMIYSNAVKDKSKGRASAGLLIYLRKYLKSTIIEQNNMWILVKIDTEHITFTLGLVYFPPSNDIKVCLDLLQDSLNGRTENFIILGDFNARIGSLNQMDGEILENINMFEERVTLDNTINPRGRYLTEFMEENGFLVLNGRTFGDTPARPTFLGTTGKSVIDLCWADLSAAHLIKDSATLDVSLDSDHIPYTITLWENSAMEEQKVQSREVESKLIWKPHLSHKYSNIVEIKLSDWNLEADVNNFINIIKKTAEELDMKKNIFQNKKNIKEKRPWYNEECKELKKEVKIMYNRAKRDGFEEDCTLQYVETKKKYRKFIKLKKDEYSSYQISMLSTSKDPNTFWNTLNEMRTRKYATNTISIEEWQEYFTAFYKEKKVENYIWSLEPSHSFLDCDIEMSEVVNALNKLKNKKAPGLDQVSNEFLKNLNMNGKKYLLKSLNFIFKNGNIPKTWSETKMVLFFKKGDANNPDNYRGISLLNTITKLFTAILSQRLLIWAEANKIIPECQSGFRKRRGCSDNIFVLTSIIGGYLRLKGRKVYAAFIDFKRAFDSIDHQALWKKLQNIGVSNRMIHLIKKIYDNAEMRIQINNTHSANIKITKGVLQGDSLSPLLFILFISDLPDFLSENGAGVNIDENINISALLYADDLTLLSETPIKLQKLLNSLHKYSDNNHLEVNREKSKVMIFRRGGRNPDDLEFKYGGVELQIVNEFSYLGVTLSSSGLFLKAAKERTNKAIMAMPGIKSLIRRAKIDTYQPILKLYESMITSVLLYASEIWALNYQDVIERSQVIFFKSLFFLNTTTPGYVLRSEFQQPKIITYAYNRAIGWLCKILTMNDERLPKACFARMLKLSEATSVDKRYNWAQQLKEVFHMIGEDKLWKTQDPQAIKENIPLMTQKLQMHFYREDMERSRNSLYCKYYGLAKEQSHLLNIRLPLVRRSVLHQIRTCNEREIKFYIKGNTYKIDPKCVCSICNTEELEDLAHILIGCPLYAELREVRWRLGISDNVKKEQLLEDIINPTTSMEIARLCKYIESAMRIRAFICNE